MKKLRCTTVKRLHPFSKHLQSNNVVLGSVLGLGHEAKQGLALRSPR